MQRFLSSLLVLLLACLATAAQSKPHLYVTVTLAPTVADKAVSGRLLIFMSSKLDPPSTQLGEAIPKISGSLLGKFRISLPAAQ